MHDILLNGIEAARQSAAFRNYLQVRDRVLDMLEEAQEYADPLSDYWKEESASVDYMLDASPLVIRNLREHCYHLTGLRSYEYRGHHAHQAEPFARKLQALRQLDTANLFVPEPPALGGFGHAVEGSLINLDTLKYYESLIALSKAGILAQFRAAGGERKTVVEIGAGWGGFAYQFKTLYPHTCYVIVDLPQSLLFSGVYLKTLFPDASVLFYGDRPTNTLLEGYDDHDFVFLPHFFMKKMKLARIDLGINMVSFQEMTSDQVDAYVRRLAELGCPNLYSHNRDRSPHNAQLSTVSSIIERYYDTVEQKVLDVPYTDLTILATAPHREMYTPIEFAKSLIRRLSRQGKPLRERSVHEYRHLIGVLKAKRHVRLPQ